MFICVCVAHFTEAARGSTSPGAMLSDKSDNIARLRRDLNPRILIMHVLVWEYNPKLIVSSLHVVPVPIAKQHETLCLVVAVCRTRYAEDVERIVQIRRLESLPQ